MNASHIKSLPAMPSVPKQNEEANSYANARVSRDLTKSKRSHALRTKVLILQLNLFESDS